MSKTKHLKKHGRFKLDDNRKNQELTILESLGAWHDNKV